MFVFQPKLQGLIKLEFYLDKKNNCFDEHKHCCNSLWLSYGMG